ncbi:hypothetical protein OXB_1372 [Bacillus sp. OxB-1]|uniref:DUF4230 domain-containing protein n=1 Tax=Bacillus sp. (strain OxB-1) TaxID=98228 RepID=UPI000581D1D1|nr:DUF4230 domain-containing protein [Bacillus sp. OxB-1]BAQ09843.1 hypothetical protein OXB_1372 [Bacillus sp. OxB-1]
MAKDKKLDEIEKLLQEVRSSQKESAVTVDEMGPRKKIPFWKVGKLFFSVWRKSFILIGLLILALLVALPFVTFHFLKTGSTATEEKGVFLERIQELQQLTTAEVYTKVIIERRDNQLFGQDIGLNVPGTKRQLLVIIPGSVKAGVDLSGLTEKDIVVHEEQKKIELAIPPATFLGGAELFFDQVEVYSYEGVFREKANIEEAYELAAEAKKLIVEEASGQGILQTAQHQAEQTLEDMFSFTGYDVTIKVKE